MVLVPEKNEHPAPNSENPPVATPNMAPIEKYNIEFKAHLLVRYD